jgi:thiamine biosynthesis lipoprotein
MGTLVEITVIARDTDRAEAAIGDAFDEMERVEGLMSRKIPGSDVSEINRGAGIKAVHVSPEVLHVIRRAEEISKASEGYFDITIGALLDLWGFEADGHRLPTEGEVSEALDAVGSTAVLVDERGPVAQIKGISEYDRQCRGRHTGKWEENPWTLGHRHPGPKESFSNLGHHQCRGHFRRYLWGL